MPAILNLPPSPIQWDKNEFLHLGVNEGDEKIVVNVGGFRHEVMASTLNMAPDTRLHWVAQKNTQSPNYDPIAGEFFFDRNPLWFPYILNYYRVGKIHCPSDVCGAEFSEELQFWGIEETAISWCCSDNYHKRKEANMNLQSNIVSPNHDFNNESYVSSLPSPPATRKGRLKQGYKNGLSIIWSILEYPDTSRFAQIFAFISMMFIVLSVIVFCLETVDYFSKTPASFQAQALVTIETICVVWFTFEFIIRLITCPDKVKFAQNLMNWVDLCAVAPFFISLTVSENVKTIIVLRITRLIRVFRILKLSRHSYGLQVLGHTLKASFRELCLLAFFLLIGVIIFSSLVYYAEKDSNSIMFPSIPASFWWSIVTMTTIGYGDVVPITFPGKCVGVLCALCGVLVIALPVPVIVSNFSLYYSHYQAKLRSDDKETDLKNNAVRKFASVHSWLSSGLLNPLSVPQSSFCTASTQIPITPTVHSYSSMHQYDNYSFHNSAPSSPSSNNLLHEKRDMKTGIIKNTIALNKFPEKREQNGNFSFSNIKKLSRVYPEISKRESMPSSTADEKDSVPKFKYNQLIIQFDPPSVYSNNNDDKVSGEIKYEPSPATYEPSTTKNKDTSVIFKFKPSTKKITKNSSVSQNHFLSPHLNSSHRGSVSSGYNSATPNSALSVGSISESLASIQAKTPYGRMGRRNGVIMASVFGVKWKKKTFDSNKNKTYILHQPDIYSTKQAKPLKEASSEHPSTIRLSPVETSALHVRRQRQRSESVPENLIMKIFAGKKNSLDPSTCFKTKNTNQKSPCAGDWSPGAVSLPTCETSLMYTPVPVSPKMSPKAADEVMCFKF